MKKAPFAGISRFVAHMRHLGSFERRRLGVAVIAATTMAGAPEAEVPATSPPTGSAVAPALVATPAPERPADADHARVDFWVGHYTGPQRAAFEDQMRRRGRYDRMIREKLAARGLPEDLIYLAWIESGFLPSVQSHAGAVGLWQFMPETARWMGLRVDDEVDERRDPVRSTDAAVEFLDRLHRHYGSWHLAMAAYNGGPTRVTRIVRHHGDGSWGHEGLYWQVLDHLPRETGHYVPRFLAVRAVAEAMAAAGFEEDDPEPYAYSLVWVDRSWTFAQIARVAEIPVETLRELNPHLIRDRTPRAAGPYPLRVPAGSAIRVASRLVRPDRGYAMADD